MVDIASYGFKSRAWNQQVTRKIKERNTETLFREDWNVNVKYANESLALANVGAIQFTWRYI